MTSPYTPLIYDDLGFDPDSLVVAMQQRLAATYPGWSPGNGSVVTALLNVVAIAAADLRAMVVDTGAGFLAGVGALLQVDRIRAVPATALTSWSFTDSGGHLVPAGTPVNATTGDYGDFLLPTDLMVPLGQTTAAGVLVVAAQAGTVGNGLPAGPAVLGEALIDVSGVVVTDPGSGGVDPETDSAYRARVADRLRLLSDVPVLPLDYARLATDIAGIARALAVKGWDATNGQTGVASCVTVVALDAAGHPATSAEQTQLIARLDAARGVNDLVRTTSPTYVTVHVTTSVVAALGASPAAVQAAVVAETTSYLSPATWAPTLTAPPTWSGDPLLRPLDLAARIRDLPGVAHVTSLDINGGGTAVVDLSQGLPATQRYAVLPAGVNTDPAWSSPSTVAVTVTAGT